jgi:hypothetical protein
MQKAIVIALAAFTTTGCSHLVYPGLYAAARPRMVVPTPLPPMPIGRWDSVTRLPRGSVVDVLSMNGEAFVGPVAGVDGSAVRLVVRGVEEQIPRAEVLRVDVVELPGSEAGAVAKQAGLGAALGVGSAALIAGVIGGPAWPTSGALVRGGAAIGGIAGEEAALAARQGRLIYLAEQQGSTRYSSGRPSLPIEHEVPARFLIASGAAPLVRLGAPTLPFGGAQAQILQFQAGSSHAVPSPTGAPPPAAAGVASAPRVTRTSICYAPAVRIRR